MKNYERYITLSNTIIIIVVFFTIYNIFSNGLINSLINILILFIFLSGVINPFNFFISFTFLDNFISWYQFKWFDFFHPNMIVDSASIAQFNQLLILVLLIIVLIQRSQEKGFKQEPFLQTKLLWIFLFLLFVVFYISSTLSKNSSSSFSELSRLLKFPILSFIVLNTIDSMDRLKKYYIVLLIIAFLETLFALKDITDWERSNATGYLVGNIPLIYVFYMSFRYKIRISKIIYVTFFIILILGAFVSASRRVLLACILYIFLLKILTDKKKSMLNIIKGFLIVTVIIFISYKFIIPEFSKERINYTLSPNNANQLMTGREKLWRSAWILFKQSMYFGIGVNQSFYKTADTARQLGYQIRYKYIRVHNTYLKIMVDTGMIGIFIYFIIILIGIYYLIKARNIFFDIPFYFYLTNAILAGWIIQHIIGFFGWSGIYGKTFWINLGLILVLYNFSQQKDDIELHDEKENLQIS